MPFKNKPETYKGLIRNFAKASGKSVRMVDKMFQKAEEVVEKKLKIPRSNPKFYAMVVGMLKNWLKLKNYKKPVQEIVNRLLETYLYEQEDFDKEFPRVEFVRSRDLEDYTIEYYKVYDEKGRKHNVEVSYKFDFENAEDENDVLVVVEVIWDGVLDYEDSYNPRNKSDRDRAEMRLKKRYPELAKYLDKFLPLSK